MNIHHGNMTRHTHQAVLNAFDPPLVVQPSRNTKSVRLNSSVAYAQRDFDREVFTPMMRSHWGKVDPLGLGVSVGCLNVTVLIIPIAACLPLLLMYVILSTGRTRRLRWKKRLKKWTDVTTPRTPLMHSSNNAIYNLPCGHRLYSNNYLDWSS